MYPSAFKNQFYLFDLFTSLPLSQLVRSTASPLCFMSIKFIPHNALSDILYYLRRKIIGFYASKSPEEMPLLNMSSIVDSLFMSSISMNYFSLFFGQFLTYMLNPIYTVFAYVNNVPHSKELTELHVFDQNEVSSKLPDLVRTFASLCSILRSFSDCLIHEKSCFLVQNFQSSAFLIIFFTMHQ